MSSRSRQSARDRLRATSVGVSSLRRTFTRSAGVTPWRIFLTLYNQLGGPKILDDGGTRITMDDATAIKALQWMAEPHKRGVAAAAS